jgi:predicted O-methyltransferase YrrM
MIKVTLFCLVTLFQCSLSIFPIEKPTSNYNDTIDLRYKELLPLMNSATWVAEKFMNRSGIFNSMGGIFSVEAEVKYYYRLANLPEVNIICDIGFNAGHSAITFLQSNPNATVISFDIVKLPWTQNSVEYVKSLYGNRFHFIKGDSAQLMRAAASNTTIMNNLKCDLLSVDGNHGKAWDDISLGFFVSRPFAYVVVDDYASHMTKILRDWNRAIEKKIIEEIDCHKDIEYQRGNILTLVNFIIIIFHIIFRYYIYLSLLLHFITFECLLFLV